LLYSRDAVTVVTFEHNLAFIVEVLSSRSPRWGGAATSAATAAGIWRHIFR
jgi:hypothetical protein